MNAITVKVRNFIKIMLSIAAIAVFCILIPGGHIKNSQVSASNGEDNRRTGELSDIIYAIQYFTPARPWLDGIELIVAYDDQKVSGGQVTVWLFDDSGVLAGGCSLALADVNNGGYTYFPINSAVKVGHTYRYNVSYQGGTGVGPNLIYRGLLTAGPAENVSLSLSGAVYENGSAACKYVYSYPLSLLQKAVYTVFFLLVLAIVSFGCNAFPRTKFLDKEIRVDKVIRVGLVGCVLAAMAVLTYYALIRKAFGGSYLDHITYALGIVFLGGYLLVAFIKTNLNLDKLGYLKTREGILRAVRIAAIVYFIVMYAEFTNSGLQYFHDLYSARMYAAVGIFVASFLPKDKKWNKISVIYVALAVIGIAAGILLKNPDADARALQISRNLCNCIWIYVILRTVWNLIHRRCRRFSIPFAAVVALLFVLMLVFRNGKDWPIQLVVMYGIFYLQPISTDDEHLLLKDICTAIMIAFVHHVGFSIIFRPYYRYEFNRYPGIFSIVAVWGIYLTMTLAVLLVKLLTEKKKDKSFAHMWAYYLLVAVCGGYIVLSITRTAIVAAIVMLVMLPVLTLICDRRNVMSCVRAILVSLAFMIMLLPGIYTLTRTVPAMVSKPKIHRFDVNENTIFAGTAWDSRQYMSVPKLLSIMFDRMFLTFDGSSDKSPGYFDENGVWREYSQEAYESLQNDDLSKSGGRVDIWKAYIQNLNMTGHKDMFLDDGEEVYAHAHNIVLQEAYDFGIPTAAVFLAFGLMAFVRSILYVRRNSKRSLFTAVPFTVIIAFVVVGMFEWIFYTPYPITMLLMIVIAPLLSPIKKNV